MPQSKSEIAEANRLQVESETDPFTAERYIQFHSHFPPGATKVLDVGCGTGRGGEVLKSRHPSVDLTGLDLLPERIQVLDKKVYSKAICAFAADIPAESNCYDVVLAGEFLEHVASSQVDGILAEFFRVLRLRGRLLLTTPNPHYLRNKIQKLSVLCVPAHISQHYPDCLAYRLRMSGFSKIKIFGSGKVSRYFGQRFPLRSIYGSYLVRGDKW